MGTRTAAVVWLLAFAAAGVFAGPDYPVYPWTVVHRFPPGSGGDALGRYIAPSMAEYTGPTSLSRAPGGDWQIMDPWNRRLNEYDRNFNLTASIVFPRQPLGGEYRFFAGGTRMICALTPDSWAGYTREGELFFACGYTHQLFPRNVARSFWYHNGIIFFHDIENRLVSITEPSTDPAVNRASFRTTEQTRALFLPDSGFDLEGLTIDEQDRLFLDGELATLDYPTFLGYWQGVHQAAGNSAALELLAGWPSVVCPDRTGFVGRDADGNWYWNDNIAMLVFTPAGELLEFFVFPEEKITTRPAVSPEGDVYVMHYTYSYSDVEIYRVTRRW